MQKDELLRKGSKLITEFCLLNSIQIPNLITHQDDWHFSVCAYYRNAETHIHLQSCASAATESQVRNWNYPGSTTDRTPYGVLAHELGHHCDLLTGSKPGTYWSEYSESVQQESGESPITSYCPNPAEWFAEMFRLFVTNPDLLSRLRPKTFSLLKKRFQPCVSTSWVESLLPPVPQRIINNLRKKIDA